MVNITKKVNIIGAGLAGSEAAWQLAERGIGVRLFEMRPRKTTAAHTTEYFGELVCSNSLRAAGLGNAVGLLKEEMRMHDSLIMRAADNNRIPAGGALAVDREGFGKEITEAVCGHPNIEVIREEVTDLQNLLSGGEVVIIAAGPLASEELSAEIAKLIDEEYLHFHDAVAPIVDGGSIDFNVAFRASRYGRGDNPEGDYINCPMDKEQYLRFYEELVQAETVPLKNFEKEKDFSGCMPIESMAKKGVDTIRFGPLKPVGIKNPHQEGREEYAIVQLRQDNAAGTMFNIVGFQTRLTWPEQRRVFRLIPGLENAEFLRLGVMHRNTFINSSKLTHKNLYLKKNANIYFAGQITGVEGYIESAACGMAVGINAARKSLGQSELIWPLTTALGGLLNYITTPNGSFQPMNVTFGLIEPLGIKVRKKREKNEMLSQRAVEDMAAFIAENKINGK
ncbi:MAG: methylenetetrahydrofolate--tRNA-(uracil(54)-C(5))-methyltransferase (FADH(2)-oxidizing) TrmFO [Bacillota bacterium]|jgi:methylenetetrahydrofolate--tRNA-(uracil-5-)-methyltransferase